MKMTPEGLAQIRERVRAERRLREGGCRVRITVHMGTCGVASGSREVLAAFESQLAASGRSDILLTTAGCAGLCSSEPMATIEIAGQPPVKYIRLTPEIAGAVFNDHVLGGTIVKDFALSVGNERVS